MNDERSNDLNRRLRAGDPFLGESGLTPEEVRALRRTVLTAQPEPRRRLLPALALAGAAAAVLLIAVFAFRPGSDAIPPAPQAAAAPAHLPPGPAPEGRLQTAEAAPATAAPTTERAETRKPHLRLHRRPPAGETPAPNTALAALNPSPPEDGTAIREIQFSTPGGTRIIWTLAPGKTSF
jgi:hypothetical protein